jgi:hypothetical protein
VSTCPEIDELLVAGTAPHGPTRAHIDACGPCAAVAALASFRRAARAPAYPAEACAEFEPSIAAMVEGNVHRLELARLVAHLADCASCSDVAARITLFRPELDDVPDPTPPRDTSRAATSPGLGEPTVIVRQPSPPAATVNGVERAARALRAIVPPRPLRLAWAAQLAAAACLAALLTHVVVHDPHPPAIEPAHDSSRRSERAGGGEVTGALERAAQAERRTQEAEARARELEREVAGLRERIDELEEKSRAKDDARTTSREAPTSEPSVSPAPSSSATGERGFLTIVCNPFCDDVKDNGKSLGPSPIVRVAVPPGEHRLTMQRKGVPTKVVTVTVVAGQATAQRISMRGDGDLERPDAPRGPRRFDRDAAQRSIRSMVDACVRGSDARPGTGGSVTATFAPEGVVTAVSVTPGIGSFASCVSSSVRGLRTPLFDGDAVTVTVPVAIGDPLQTRR